jgi:hypothetical protein
MQIKSLSDDRSRFILMSDFLPDDVGPIISLLTDELAVTLERMVAERKLGSRCYVAAA